MFLITMMKNRNWPDTRNLLLEAFPLFDPSEYYLKYDRVEFTDLETK